MPEAFGKGCCCGRAGGSGAGCGGGSPGSYLYVRSYLKSDDFLTMLGQSAVDDMNVDAARIAPLDWDGSGIRCDGVTMEGHEFLTSLQAKNIETEFSRWDLLKRAFVITSVNIAELKLQLARALPFPGKGRGTQELGGKEYPAGYVPPGKGEH